MSPERQRKVVEVFEAALELDGEQRGAFIERASDGDPSFRDEVWSLIIHDEKAGSFIEEPAVNFSMKAVADARAELSEGNSLGPYLIIRHLGEGGMGVVYLARHTKLDRLVALKLLPEHFTQDRDKVRRFEQEARAASKLQHHNIITIYDIAQTGRLHYIVTEYVDGQTLREHMAAGPVSVGRVIEIVEQVASALKAAHEAGIVHRDIKPENIMIRRDGVVKVLDFGLAKLAEAAGDSSAETLFHTRPGLLIGTPSYMSPEQVSGVGADARSDIFSLGAVLYECLTSRPAFSGLSVGAILGEIQHVNPPPPSRCNPRVTPDLDRITLKALQKKLESRYQSAEDLLADLRGACANLPSTKPWPLRQKRLKLRSSLSRIIKALPARVQRARVLFTAVFLGLVAASLAGWVWLHWPRQPAPKAAELCKKGTTALREGTYYKASKMLEEAVRIDGQYALARARLAEALMELDYTDRAKDEMMATQSIVRQHGAPSWLVLSSFDRLYIEAIDATIRRDFAKAIDIYKDIASSSSGEPHIYVDLGYIYEKAEDVENAVVNYQKAVALDQQYAAPHLRLGVLYGRKQDTVAALQAFNSAEKIYLTLSDQEGVAEVHYRRGALFQQRGELAKARDQLQKALDMARTTNSINQRVKVLLLLSGVAHSEGNTAEAKHFATEAVELAQANGMETLATWGLHDLGYSLLVRRAYEDAELHFKQALDFARRYRGRQNEARIMLSLGTLYIYKVDPDKGVPYIEKALTYFREGHYRKEISKCLDMIGRAKLLKGEYDAALKTFDEQLQLARQVDDPGQVARSQNEIGLALARQELYPQALRCYDESYSVSVSLDNPLAAGFSLLNRADMLARLGRYEEAYAALDKLPSYTERLDPENRYRHLWTIWTHLIKARMALSERRLTEAAAECRHAVTLASAPQFSPTLAEAKATFGLTLTLTGEKQEGRRLSEEALALAKSTGDAFALSNALITFAEVLLESKDWQGSLAYALEAQKLFASVGRHESEWRAWGIAALASRRLHLNEPAHDYLSRADYSFNELKRNWGDREFNSYLSRTDIKSYRGRLTGAQ